MRAQILSYSRSRGLFAGVTLNGSTISQDRDANERFYGKPYHDGADRVRWNGIERRRERVEGDAGEIREVGLRAEGYVVRESW